MAEITFGNVAAGQQFVIRDGDIAIPDSPLITNDGSIVVASGATATLELTGRTITGSGKIFVDETSNLTITTTNDVGNLDGVTLTNGGQLTWGGHVLCGEHFVLENFGALTLATPKPDIANFYENGELNVGAWHAAAKEMFPDTRAAFILREGTLTGAGIFNGGLQLAGGRIKLGAPITGNGEGTVLAPAPSPDYMLITGDVSTTSGVMEIEITPSYYGQMSATGTASLGGGGLTVALNGYTPAYAEAYRVLICTNITGQFSSFNATALNFDNRGIITVTTPISGKAYRLSGY